MMVNEVAGLLGYSREQVKTLLEEGLRLPFSGTMLSLAYTDVGGQPDISDEQFNEFVAKFDAEEPGRWPPAEVRRELLVEARHACAICRTVAPPQFHHMLDWAKVRHHDAKRMLMLCGTCHSRCTNGQIDYKAQMQYKARLQDRSMPGADDDAHRETRRLRDLAAIKDLFSIFPRPLVDTVLEQATMDRIHTDHIDCLIGAEGIFRSTIFHLYDMELRDRLADFFNHWNRAWHVGRTSHRDQMRQGLATLSLGDLDSSERWEEHKLYLQHVMQAQRAMAGLTKHLHQVYPDFDLTESDRDATRKYWEMVERVEKQMKEMMENPLGRKDDEGASIGDGSCEDEVAGVGEPLTSTPSK